jgi:hypothetical protein
VPASTPTRWALRVLRRTLDTGLLAVVCCVAWMLLHRAAESANVRADRRIVAAEAVRIYSALQSYYETNRSYPNSWVDPAFETDTLEPLRRRGYYKGHVTTKLLRGRVDAYDSPDDRGPNQEFWIEMSLESDSGVRFLVARSDDAPLGGGHWRDGAFIYRNGSLERL